MTNPAADAKMAQDMLQHKPSFCPPDGNAMIPLMEENELLEIANKYALMKKAALEHWEMLKLFFDDVFKERFIGNKQDEKGELLPIKSWSSDDNAFLYKTSSYSNGKILKTKVIIKFYPIEKDQL